MSSDTLLGRQRPIAAKVFASVALAIASLPLFYVVGAAYWQGPTFRDLLAGLGAPLPKATTLFLASFRWWALFLVLFTVIAVDILRRPRISVPYLLLAALGTVTTAIVLHT